MKFNFNDGGRAAAGFKGQAGDCVTRAIAIATGLPYRQVYDGINQIGSAEKVTRSGPPGCPLEHRGAAAPPATATVLAPPSAKMSGCWSSSTFACAATLLKGTLTRRPAHTKSNEPTAALHVKTRTSGCSARAAPAAASAASKPAARESIT